jgi:mono/diheme cytochrome c family protein
MTPFRSIGFSIVFLLFLFSGCNSQPYTQGQAIYDFHCGGCHMEDGSGLAKLIPPLDSSRLTLSDPAKLVCLIRKGLPINTVTGQKMPANSSMTDVELANLINFLGVEYGYNPQTIKVTEIKKMLAVCQSD